LAEINAFAGVAVLVAVGAAVMAAGCGVAVIMSVGVAVGTTVAVALVSGITASGVGDKITSVGGLGVAVTEGVWPAA